MRIILKHLSGSDEGKREVHPVRRLSIGRDEGCDVQFDLQRDLEVSGRHAELVPLDGEKGVEIVDLNSTNGILVNGQEVERQRLKSGDIIELGPGGPRLRYELRRALFRTLFSRIFGSA